MEKNPTLIIKASEATIIVMAKYMGEFVEHEIQLRLVLGYYWNKDVPVIEKLIELFETVIKRAVSQVFPHEKLSLKYHLTSNDTLEDSSKLFITFLEVKADGTELKIEGNEIMLEGIDFRSTFSKVSGFRRKVDEKIKKEIISSKEKRDY
ncbi:MAG: hypothetical protein LBU74_07775 [Methanobacteriaceae archaeon]|jgi:hypothetical protein|nr:hypothetical protein [Candidatus Methanorudis spinitermitis]